jgi:hypothetical protein
MFEIKIDVHYGRAHHGNFEGHILTTGMTGPKVQFTFSEEFDDLKKTAFVRGSGVEVQLPVAEDDTILVPEECLTVPGGLLQIGVYATNELTGYNKAVRIPTTWADVGIIYPGIKPSGDIFMEKEEGEDETIIVEEETDEGINDLYG